MPQNSQLVIEEAKSFADYLFLRSLRNQVRESMTNRTEQISYLEQIKFYCANKYSAKGNRSLQIFIARCGSRRAAYLLLKQTGDSIVLTEAVDWRFRRRGIGKALIQFAKTRCAKLAAEIREDNVASIALHRAMGFQVEGKMNGIVRFCWQCEQLAAG